MSGTRQYTRFYATRPRRVPPELCTDELLESCSLLAALTLYRIISQADDQGRLPGHPKYIKGICFPMRPDVTVRRIGTAIDELADARFLLRYVVQGRTFLQVDRWPDMQGKWGRRAYPSRYPAPPGWAHDWVSVSEADAQELPSEHGREAELRALGAQSASDLHAPISFTPSVAPTAPSSDPLPDLVSRLTYRAEESPPFDPTSTRRWDRRPSNPDAAGLFDPDEIPTSQSSPTARALSR